jgi:hypothetical protein
MLLLLFYQQQQHTGKTPTDCLKAQIGEPVTTIVWPLPFIFAIIFCMGCFPRVWALCKAKKHALEKREREQKIKKINEYLAKSESD